MTDRTTLTGPAPDAGRHRPDRTTWLVFGAGVVGAVSIPGWHVGVGWLVCAGAVATVAVLAKRRPPGGAVGGAAGGADPADLSWRVAAGLAAAAFGMVPALRSAGWLVGLCLFAALPLASYALVGGRNWRDLAPAFVALPRAVPDGLAAVCRSSTKDGGDGRLRVALATGVGIVLVLGFGALFRAADPRFAALVGSWADRLPPSTVMRLVTGFLLMAGLAAGVVDVAVHSGRWWREPGGTPPVGRTLRFAEWGVPLSMLVALFGLFVWVQLGTLFGGRAYVMDPHGPDFAEYARTGFALLVVVTALTLGVVAAVARLADRVRARDRVALRALGGSLCALTLVIVGSALSRMHLYVDAYGFSGRRLAGYAVETWLGLLFLLVMGAGWRLRAGWLPRATVATSVVVLLGVAAVNPEALMARTHIDRLERGYPVDLDFIAGLSADAAGELDRLPEPQRSCALLGVNRELAVRDAWNRWNLGRSTARALFVRRAVQPGEGGGVNCWQRVR